MTERIRKLCAFTEKYDLYMPIVKVDYDRNDLFLSDLACDTKRLCDYMLAQDIRLDQDVRLTGFFRFDGSVPSDIFHRTGHRNFSKFSSQFYNKPLENLATFEWQHSTADFRYVIENGMEGYLARIEASEAAHKDDPEGLEFLSMMKKVVLTIIKLAEQNAEKCRAAAEKEEGERKAELLKMAAIFDRVPRYPARTFREAVQSLSMCFIFLPDCIGTIDRYLRPYYEADLASGEMTRAEAGELLQELFIDISAHTEHGGNRDDFSAESHFAIGGYLPNGEDGFNDLSRLIVESLMEMPINKPQITLRWTKKLPFETFRYILDCERNDKLKRIAFVSDEPRIASFMQNLGLSYEDACNYTMVGCNEPSLQGGIWLGGCTSNIARAVTDTLYGREDDLLKCRNFDEFYAVYEEELTKVVNRIIEISDGFNFARSKDINVLSSIFLDGCIENARSVTRGGARLALSGTNLMGTTATIDSLSMVKQFVFEDQIFTMEELLAALKADWKGYEEMQTLILTTGKFFGNNDPLSDDVARRFTTSLHTLLKDRRNLFGNHFLCGCLAGYNPHYVWFGNATAATPDGRNAGDPFMVGAGQSGGRDREGLAALLNSVAQMDPEGILCGPFVCNLTLEESLVRDDAKFEKTARMIETYFKKGGLHVQLNYVSREELLKAKADPAHYAGIRVRVSGFSGTFVNLQESIQDDVVNRTVEA